MNFEGCVDCDWMTQDLDDVCRCSLYDKPIEMVESCDPNNLNYQQELLIIEECRRK